MLGMLQEVADEVINPRFRSLESGQIHEKAPGDLVTDADREAEVVITARLRAAFPDAVVLGEEAFAGDPTSLASVLRREPTPSPSTRSTAPRTSSTARATTPR